MHSLRRPARARKAPRRVVLPGVIAALGLITPFTLVGCGSPPESSPAVAVPDPGPGETEPPASPVQVGEMAPDFVLRDLDGDEVRLSDYRGQVPVLIEFGSLTCPMVTGRSAQLDTAARDYLGKAQFWFVYSNEEHPGHGESRTSNYGTFCALPQVRDYGDRRERARHFQHTVDTTRRILVDEDGADCVAARYGFRGHRMVVVDAQGRVSWVSPPEAGGVPPGLYDALGNPG